MPSTDVFAQAQDAFDRLRGLAFTIEWRRFPWTYGVDVDLALIGPAYLGHVALGLKDGWSWGYQNRRGAWRYVQRDRVEFLVEAVIHDRAGYRPPLPNRAEYRQLRHVR